VKVHTNWPGFIQVPEVESSQAGHVFSIKWTEWTLSLRGGVQLLSFAVIMCSHFSSCYDFTLA